MKAILVIDMPNTCAECPLKVSDRLPTGCVFRRWYSLSVNETYRTNKWCPLKPIPERKKVGEIERVDDFMKSEIRVIAERVEAQIRLDTELLLATGYNACLDEILGDKK